MYLNEGKVSERYSCLKFMIQAHLHVKYFVQVFTFLQYFLIY